jgi:hypothetical protein
MIRNIIELLKSDSFIDAEEIIQVAKGKYKTPENLKEGINYIRRRNHGRSN